MRSYSRANLVVMHQVKVYRKHQQNQHRRKQLQLQVEVQAVLLKRND